MHLGTFEIYNLHEIPHPQGDRQLSTIGGISPVYTHGVRGIRAILLRRHRDNKIQSQQHNAKAWGGPGELSGEFSVDTV